jgi:hypothetical protein
MNTLVRRGLWLWWRLVFWLRKAQSFPLQGRVVPPSFFGMHLIKLWIARWPEVPFGLYRMHDTTPRWHQLYSEEGFVDGAGVGMSRITSVFDYMRHNNASQPTIYVLGGGGEGHGGFPDFLEGASLDVQLHHWRVFIREVTARFPQIRYWEVWNEPDGGGWYHGDATTLVALTRCAYATLKAAHPDNVVIGPSFTFGDGGALCAEWRRLGGEDYCDVAAIHTASTRVPENDFKWLVRTRELFRKPVWITEGHPAQVRGLSDAAVIARHYLVQWLAGYPVFCWYAWDIGDYHDSYVDWITLANDQGAPNNNARAYDQVRQWLEGRNVEAWHVVGGAWVLRLGPGDQYLAWSVTSDAWLPVDGTITRLDGTSQVLSGVCTTTPEPVLISNRS